MPSNRAGASSHGSRPSNQSARASNQSARPSNQGARAFNHTAMPSSWNANPSTHTNTRPSTHATRPSAQAARPITNPTRPSAYNVKLSSDLVLDPQGVDAMRDLQRTLEGYNDLSIKAGHAWRHAMDIVVATPSKNRRQAEATFLSHELDRAILEDTPARAYQLATLERAGPPVPWTEESRPLSHVAPDLYHLHASARDVSELLGRIDEIDASVGKVPASEADEKKLDEQLRRLDDLLGRVLGRQKALNILIEELEDLLDVKTG